MAKGKKKGFRFNLPPLPDTVFLSGNAAKADVKRRSDNMQRYLLAQNKDQGYLPMPEQETEPVPEITESDNLTLFS